MCLRLTMLVAVGACTSESPSKPKRQPASPSARISSVQDASWPVDGGGTASATDDADGPDAATANSDDWSPVGCQESLRLLRFAAWPGGGFQIVFEDAGASQEPPDISLAGSAPLTRSATAPSAGITGIVLVPTVDAELHAARKAAARAIVEALPAAERVALWISGETLRLGSELTSNRARVLERLAAVPGIPGVAPDASLLGSLRNQVADVEGPWGSISRFLVLVGPAGDGPFPSDEHRVGLLQLSERLDFALEKNRFGWRRRSPTSAGASLGTRIEARRGATLSFGGCADLTPGERVTFYADGKVACELLAPPDIVAPSDADCDPEGAAADAYPFASRVELLLDDRQWSVFKRRAADKSESDFDASLRFGEGRAVDVRAHFRGQTSLGCERKSLAIDLDGRAQRRLAGTGVSDEFYLISLCKDEGYFRQLFGNRVFFSLGLFPLASRLVEFRINGRSLGVYLLLEKPHEALRADHLGISAIVRRRFDPGGKPATVKFPKNDTEAMEARARYDQLAQLAADGNPAELDVLLGRMLDVDGYLRLLALNTLLVNGDSVDEVYFYATPEGTDHEARWMFRVMAWDLDDLGAGCHHRGEHAFSRGDGLMYCTEGDLDRALLRSDPIYLRYLDILSQLAERDLSSERVQNELAGVRAELFEALSHDSICEAMVELSPELPTPSCAELQSHIDAEIRKYQSRVERQRTQIRSAMAAFRSGP